MGGGRGEAESVFSDLAMDLHNTVLLLTMMETV